MKRFIQLAAFIVALLLLCGCEQRNSSAYLSVAEHDDPYAVKETDTTQPESEQDAIQLASNYYSMRTILRRFIKDGVEHGQLRLTQYDGEVEEDLRRATEFFTKSDPVGAYAIDYMTYEKVRTGGDWLVSIDTVYRRSAGEIQAIRSVRGIERANALICSALTQFDSAVTLQVSGFEEEDFAQVIRSYCLNHPEAVIQIPETSVAIYPDTGNVRIVELHFTYTEAKDDLRSMLSSVTAILNSANAYIRSEADDSIKASMLYSYLMGRYSYTAVPEGASVYSLLCEGVADSASFAGVFAYLCKRAGVECRIVEGTKDGLPWLWNIVKLSDVYYHVDLMQCAATLEPKLRPLLDTDMAGYSWDTAAYPVCDGQPQPEQAQP